MPQPLTNDADDVTLFLCGDVMTGRGVDQILEHPSRPHLFEPYVRSALGYVDLAERASGSIPRGVEPAYVWGDALVELENHAPNARIVNLETSVTTAEDAWPRKGIHYRMHPANVACLTAAKIDCCVLANNHVLDWGYAGLAQTLATLHDAGIRTAGAGSNAQEAKAPAIIDIGSERRVLVFAYATKDSGTPDAWRATSDVAGVALLRDFSDATVHAIAAQISAHKHSGDLVVLSIHWGANWGYEIARSQRCFAQAIVGEAGVDVVHGHSSHHVKGIEIWRDRPIFYGCGDFLNDYEGIGGYEQFRAELSLMYFPTFGSTGALRRLAMVPTVIRRFQVRRAGTEDAAWLGRMLTREGHALGTQSVARADNELALQWTQETPT